MIARSTSELCLIVLLLFVMKRSSHVASWPFVFDDDQQQTEEQAESISENFFDEVRQLIEQKLSGGTASELDYDLSTTEMFGHHPSDERVIETTIPAEDDANSKSIDAPRKHRLSLALELARGR